MCLDGRIIKDFNFLYTLMFFLLYNKYVFLSIKKTLNSIFYIKDYTSPLLLTLCEISNLFTNIYWGCILRPEIQTICNNNLMTPPSTPSSAFFVKELPVETPERAGIWGRLNIFPRDPLLPPSSLSFHVVESERGWWGLSKDVIDKQRDLFLNFKSSVNFL